MNRAAKIRKTIDLSHSLLNNKINHTTAYKSTHNDKIKPNKLIKNSSHQLPITTYLNQNFLQPAHHPSNGVHTQEYCTKPNFSPAAASPCQQSRKPLNQTSSILSPTGKTSTTLLLTSSAHTVESESSSPIPPQQHLPLVDLTSGTFIPHPLPQHFPVRHSFRPPSLQYCMTPHNLLTPDILAALPLLKSYCQLPPRTIFARSYRDPTIMVTISHLRELLSHSSPTNNEIICLFSDLLSQSNSAVTYVKPYFSHYLVTGGWHHAKVFFTLHITSSRRKCNRPAISAESVILIPFFIHSNHWVAVSCHEVCGSVTFLYADDLNSPATEAKVKRLLSRTDPAFYPPNATWTVCHNTTFIPHSNECGPRALLVLAAMVSCQSHSTSILSHLMHPNSARISREWVAASILRSTIDRDPFQLQDAPPALL